MLPPICHALPHFVTEWSSAFALPLFAEGSGTTSQTVSLLSALVVQRTGHAVTGDRQTCIEAETFSSNT